MRREKKDGGTYETNVGCSAPGPAPVSLPVLWMERKLSSPPAVAYGCLPIWLSCLSQSCGGEKDAMSPPVTDSQFECSAAVDLELDLPTF
jgi:hypothetical protein